MKKSLALFGRWLTLRPARDLVRRLRAPLAPGAAVTIEVPDLMKKVHRVRLLSEEAAGHNLLPSELLPVYDINWGLLVSFLPQAASSPPDSPVDSFSSPAEPLPVAGRKVSIIILTWNGLDFTRRCLETLRHNTAHPSYEVIVVDNGSTDGTVEFLRGLPGIRLVENGRNLGFVRGNNKGLAVADPESDVVLLNNDIEIHQADWLTRLQAAARRAPDVGIVGCRLRRPDGVLLHAGTFMPVDDFFGQQEGGQEKDINQYPADRDVEGVVFACVYVKREVLRAIGRLDEDYFSYYEDTDYCLKARLRGFRTVCCGSVTVDHLENASTRVNRVSHGKMFKRSRQTFKKKWAAHLKQTRYDHHLDWRSIINLPTGYGLSSRNLVLALDRRGVEVAYRYVYGPGTVFPLVEPARSEFELINQISDRRFSKNGVQVVYAQGDVFEANDGAYRVGFTMLETDGFPAEWVRQANQMDEVWVPSTFNREGMLASGVTRPVHVIPLGVDPNYFHPAVRGHRDEGVFTFLSVFEWGERKAPEILLRAFCDEFAARENVALLCKVINRDEHTDVRREIKGLKLRRGGGRVLLSLNDVIPSYQRGSLYRSADCLVLCTRGEGWGLPVLEAMACGLPVIATSYSGLTDFLTEANGYPLAVERLVPARARCPYYDGFRWAEPSYDHLRTLLRHVFENRAEARARGQAAAREVLANWTWDLSAGRVIERLERIGFPAGRIRRAA